MLEKCVAASSASAARSPPVGPALVELPASSEVAVLELSYQTPARTPPVGCGIIAEPCVQVVAPTATPSQYWVITPLQVSPAVPSPP